MRSNPGQSQGVEEKVDKGSKQQARHQKESHRGRTVLPNLTSEGFPRMDSKVLAEDLSLAPRTHIGQLSAAGNCTPRGAYTHTNTNTH